MNKKIKFIIFCLLGLLIIVISLPGLFDRIQTAKLNNTLKKLVEISNAIEKYRVENKKIPEVKTFLDLKSVLQPLYIDKMPLVDGWDNQLLYHYEAIGEKQSYFIGSGGKDGQFNGFKQAGVYTSPTGSQFNKDIVLSNGKFVYYPRTMYTESIIGLTQNSDETNR